jgi:hypothetical protein
MAPRGADTVALLSALPPARAGKDAWLAAVRALLAAGAGDEAALLLGSLAQVHDADIDLQARGVVVVVLVWAVWGGPRVPRVAGGGLAFAAVWCSGGPCTKHAPPPGPRPCPTRSLTQP